MRLIDADALDAEMYHKSFEVDDGRNVWNSGLWIRYKIFEEAIRDAPTVDAVPVIRCKDCVDCKETLLDGRTWKYCETIGCTVNDDDYCCWAERRKKDNG